LHGAFDVDAVSYWPCQPFMIPRHHLPFAGYSCRVQQCRRAADATTSCQRGSTTIHHSACTRTELIPSNAHTVSQLRFDEVTPWCVFLSAPQILSPVKQVHNTPVKQVHNTPDRVFESPLEARSLRRRTHRSPSPLNSPSGKGTRQWPPSASMLFVPATPEKN
jgi:hypothetical protein